MKHYGASLPVISFLYAIMGNDILAGHYFVNADRVDRDDIHGNDASCDDANGVCQQNQQTHHRIMQPLKDSEVCHSSPHNQQLLSSSSMNRHFYRQGMSAQAYKPNAPIKTNVCEFHPTNSGDESNPPQNNVAHWSFWRSTYKDVVPIVVHANVYSCGSPSSPPPYSSSSSDDAINLEVWQPRPDGSFSSLRSGVEEGECRASVPIITNTTMDLPNLVGQVRYETLAPGSTGVLGGLIPDSSREYPPYGPGAIHMYLNMEGYHPSLVQLNMNELEDWMVQKDMSEGRFRFKGWDVRPHARESTNNLDGAGGIEIQSVKRIVRPGYDLALEVEVDLFLVTENGEEEVVGDVMEKSERDVFCSSHGYFHWISSFFKEPIAICSPSLLDFFAL
mmetsp:Transcript_14659/g.26558  ORF Transcript_14659/g.26558 Transcript_14659/m.26558 type:complete len:390 (+) Transcript_14659:129-1298(+)